MHFQLLAYKGDELIDGFQLIRNANFIGCICYQIRKTCGSDVDEVTAFLNGFNDAKPTSAPTVATGTLGFLVKHEEWIVNMIRAKDPNDVFENYMMALKGFIKDPHFKLNQLAVGDKFQIFQELATQFIDLLIYDVRLCLPTIEID